MRCKHCGMACTAKGRDMTLATFKMAIDAANDQGSFVSLGGGEPTVHPKFWEFLGYALSKDFESVWLATNGKRTDDALALANLAKTGAVAVALSIDKWHEPIDDRVVAAFEYCDSQGNRRPPAPPYSNDMREIRTTKNPIKAGRCTWGEEGCICEDIVIEPNGRIRRCGCHDSPVLGWIRDGIRSEWMDHDGGGCWKEITRAA